MTQLREQVHAPVAGPPAKYSVRHPERRVAVVGILVALLGVYLQAAPDDWLLGGLGEPWYLGAYVLAGLFLAATFAWLARRSFLEDDAYTPAVLTGIVLALVALASAVIFAIIWFV